MYFLAALSFLAVLYTCDAKINPLDIDKQESRQAALPPCPKSCCLKYCPTVAAESSNDQCDTTNGVTTCKLQGSIKNCNIRSPANICGPAVCKPKSNCNTSCAAILEIIGITICS